MLKFYPKESDRSSEDLVEVDIEESCVADLIPVKEVIDYTVSLLNDAVKTTTQTQDYAGAIITVITSLEEKYNISEDASKKYSLSNGVAVSFTLEDFNYMMECLLKNPLNIKASTDIEKEINGHVGALLAISGDL